MIKNRSDKVTEQVTISELDALTIYCALGTEIVRRERFQPPLPVHPRLRELHDKFKFIADNQPCTICGTPTLENFHFPSEGSLESGPTTYAEPCCSNGCADRIRSAEDASRSEEPTATGKIMTYLEPGKCAFNMKEAGYTQSCPNSGAQCGMCACTGPCVHELNLLCDRHAGFIEGLIFAQPIDPEDEEGLDIVAQAADRFIRTERTS